MTTVWNLSVIYQGLDDPNYEADVKAFEDAVIEMYNNRDLLKDVGNNGRKFILENLTKETGTTKNLEVLRRIVNG